MPAEISESGIRALALDPLHNFKHEQISVAEWSDAKVIIRALSAGDWIEYRRRALELVTDAQTKKSEDEASTQESMADISSASLYAFVMARTLFAPTGKRVFSDNDINDITEAFSPVHDRLVCKAFELSGIEVGADALDPVDVAGNA
jgi:hypothetical protein